MKLVSRKNLEVEVCSKDKSPYATGGICFKDDCTVSTDGHILMIVDYPKDDLEEFPLRPTGENGVKEVPLNGGIVVSRDNIQKVLKSLPKNHQYSVLQNARFKCLEKGQVEFSTTDLESWNDQTLRIVDGEFPDIEPVQVPENKVEFTSSLGVAMLENLLRCAKKAGADRINLGFPNDELGHLNNQCAIRFDFASGGELPQAVHGVLMPMMPK